MQATLVKISEVKTNPNNPRIIKNDKFKKLVQSIKDFPKMLELRPIVVNDDMIVLGGNMRLKACKEVGIKEVWVVKASDLTEEEQRQFIIKDNVGFGEWDWDMLANDWDAAELEAWGLDVDFSEEEPDTQAEDDWFEEPEEVETDIEVGDIIQIGDHRIVCGSSLDSDIVAKLMQGEKADLAHNDPPYGMRKEKDGVQNDNLNYNDLLAFNMQWIPLQLDQLKANGSFYCWGIDEPLMDIYSTIFRPLIADKKATFRNLLTWDKGGGQGQNSDNTRLFAIADEKCLFLMKGFQDLNKDADSYWQWFEPLRVYLVEEKDKMNWKADDVVAIIGKTTASHYFTTSQWLLPTEEQYKAIQAAAGGKAFLKKYKELKAIYDTERAKYEETRAYFCNTHDNMNNVWHFERTSQQERELTGGHATPKPIPLCGRAIKSSCPEGGLVLDYFLGSGSTMVAAHQLGRKCYGIELDPKYCQVVVDRMRTLDASLVVTRNGEPM